MGNGDDGVGWWKDLRLFEVGLLWPSLNVTYCALNLARHSTTVADFFDFSLSLKPPGVDLAQVLCTPQVLLTREDLPVGCLAECRFDLQKGGGQVDVIPGL